MLRVKLSKKQIKYLFELGVEHDSQLDKVYSTLAKLVSNECLELTDIEMLTQKDLYLLLEEMDEEYPDWRNPLV